MAMGTLTLGQAAQGGAQEGLPLSFPLKLVLCPEKYRHLSSTPELPSGTQVTHILAAHAPFQQPGLMLN